MASRTFNDVKINVTLTKLTDDSHALDPNYVPASGDSVAHASNIGDPTQLTSSQDLSKALGKIQNWYMKWHSVVWSGDAAKVNGYTVQSNVPSGAVFTDTTYTLSGAYGTSNNTWVTTLTPSTGSATTSTVPTASTSVYGITKLSSSTSSTSTSLAATPSAVKAAYDLASGKSTVSYSPTTASTDAGAYTIGTITIDSTPTTIYGIDTTYSAGTGLSLSGTTINHSNSITAGTASGSATGTLSFGGTFDLPTVTYDAQGHITGKGVTTLTMPANPNTDVSVKQKLNSDNKSYPILFSNYETSNTTSDPAAATTKRNNSIYVNPSTGTITATNYVGKVNNYTISGDVNVTVPADAVFTDTTYSFGTVAAGTQPYIAVKSPANTGTATKYKVEGLGSMATENTANWVPMKPDGTTDLYDSNKIINSKYLPSYVDDVIEGYYKPYDDTFTQTSNATFTVTSSAPSDWSTKYTNYFTRTGTSPNYVYTHVTGSTAPTWAASTYYALTGTTETGESGKIYVDLGEDPADPYRWSGSTYVSMRSPEINAVANVVAKGAAGSGVITVSYTNGSTSSDVTVYTHPSGNGNTHLPQGGATGQIVAYGGEQGKGAWSYLSGLKYDANTTLGVYTAATTSAAGKVGLVPAQAKIASGRANTEYFLRGDASWSDAPVTEVDILTLNVIAAS